MDADWTTSPNARRVLQHCDDARPAWLWSQDGQTLLWQNHAASLFLAKLKKSGLKLAAPAIPIKGQISRNIRLGSPGRTSLARIQFLAGEKPASSTCATTPLTWQEGQAALLIVGVDPIDAEVLDAARNLVAASEPEAQAAEPTQPEQAVQTAEALQPTPILSEWEAEPVSVTQPSETVSPTDPIADNGDATVSDVPEPGQVDEVAALEAPEPPDDANEAHDDQARGNAEPDTVVTADVEAVSPSEWDDVPESAGFLSAETEADAHEEAVPASDESAYAQELANWQDAEQDGISAFEAATDDQSEKPSSRLSLLVNRLAANEDLFTPLTEADDAPLTPAQAQYETPTMSDLADPEPRSDSIATEAPEASERPAEDPRSAEDEPQEPEVLVEPSPPPPADNEAVERVSRYNFDELARILNDRVGETPMRRKTDEPARTAALINLGGETLVLNRLPLGILVFRDQQVLFANRAITEMVGYDSVESLRSAGLAAVFPSSGPNGEETAGPVNHLAQRDGTLVPVTARLQSISWQGRPALMLSASTTEVRTSHEAAVAAFARGAAELRNDGYFEANRAGTISTITPRAAQLLRLEGMLDGKPLSALIAASDLPALRDFLERPARFAETARPSLILRSGAGGAEISVFAQGQAGIVSGYFGFVRSRDAAPVRIGGPGEADPALLSRISRGVRRPLNTIVGFADLIRSEVYGKLEAERYETYARDIAAAGQEIAALVDELDDYARLRDGRYLPQRASIDLTSLLESCVLRIRDQASSARVIVRNAISESLPRVTADRASLAQAVLNLLASAIDQTPAGGGVVISAQRGDDGTISVHVRDSSASAVDMAERFVVFRDGLGSNGRAMVPVRSSIGLALTRSLLAVNAFSLSVDPAGEQGMLFTMVIPADMVEAPATPDVAE